jgi:hypothetical protein
MAVVALAGALARLAAAGGDLWLDEIWSIELARSAGGPLAVLTALHHDNNHHLNTLYLLLVGPSASPVVQRGLALASGVLLVALLAVRAVRRASGEAAAWATFCALSYVLVHYGSEARGYSSAVALAVAAQLALARWLETRRAGWAAAFAAAAALGLLAHLSFAFVLVGLELWAAAALVRDRAARPPRATELAALAAPLAALAALWAADLRFLAIGGGPPADLAGALRELLRATLGLPSGPAELLGALAAVLVLEELVRRLQARAPEALFHAAVFAGPPAAVLVARPEVLAPRYFLVAVPSFLLLLASALARAWRRGGAARAAAAAALALLATANAGAIARLVHDGRGTYREAVATVVQSAPPGERTVGSDHDFRNRAVLEWYARGVPGGETLVYVPSGAWSEDSPAWVLLHGLDGAPSREEVVLGVNGRRYVPVRAWPAAGLSGWSWTLLRMER